MDTMERFVEWFDRHLRIFGIIILLIEPIIDGYHDALFHLASGQHGTAFHILRILFLYPIAWFIIVASTKDLKNRIWIIVGLAIYGLAAWTLTFGIPLWTPSTN